MTYTTMAGRVMAGSAAAALLFLYAGTKWKVASNVQTGVISNTGRVGFFIKTNELTLQRSHVSTGHTDGDMHMSLFWNKPLAQKATEYCEHAKFVRVHYNEYFWRNPFLAESNRKVTSIEPVEEVQQSPALTPQRS